MRFHQPIFFAAFLAVCACSVESGGKLSVDEVRNAAQSQPSAVAPPTPGKDTLVVEGRYERGINCPEIVTVDGDIFTIVDGTFLEADAFGQTVIARARETAAAQCDRGTGLFVLEMKIASE